MCLVYFYTYFRGVFAELVGNTREVAIVTSLRKFHELQIILTQLGTKIMSRFATFDRMQLCINILPVNLTNLDGTTWDHGK